MLSDSFEGGGLDGWMVESTNGSVTWQVDSMNQQDGISAAYCGKVPEYSYDFGATKARLSRWVSVPSGSSSLNFWILQDIAELLTCEHDVTRVLIGDEVVLELCGSLPNWTENNISLNDWSGSTVMPTFEFDTIDGQANKAMGVWLDHVQIVSTSPITCCAADSDCGD